MHRWIVWRSGLRTGCWECDGGGDADLWQVHAESAADALQLVAGSLRLESWEGSADLHCVAVAASKARKPRLIPPSEWQVDVSRTVEPPPNDWAEDAYDHDYEPW